MMERDIQLKNKQEEQVIQTEWKKRMNLFKMQLSLISKVPELEREKKDSREKWKSHESSEKNLEKRNLKAKYKVAKFKLSQNKKKISDLDHQIGESYERDFLPEHRKKIRDKVNVEIIKKKQELAILNKNEKDLIHKCNLLESNFQFLEEGMKKNSHVKLTEKIKDSNNQFGEDMKTTYKFETLTKILTFAIYFCYSLYWIFSLTTLGVAIYNFNQNFSSTKK